MCVVAACSNFVGSGDFPESQIIAESYAQALQANGFDVGRRMADRQQGDLYPCLLMDEPVSAVDPVVRHDLQGRNLASAKRIAQDDRLRDPRHRRSTQARRPTGHAVATRRAHHSHRPLGVGHGADGGRRAMNFVHEAISYLLTAANWTGPVGLAARTLEHLEYPALAVPSTGRVRCRRRASSCWVSGGAGRRQCRHCQCRAAGRRCRPRDGRAGGPCVAAGGGTECAAVDPGRVAHRDAAGSREHLALVGSLMVAALALVLDGLLALAVWVSAPGTDRLRKGVLPDSSVAVRAHALR